MSLRKIVTLPDAVLRQMSTPVTGVDNSIRSLMDDMLETMYDAPGIGLAAIQVGVPKRVIVMDLAGKDEEPQPRYFVNPEILWASEELASYNEGCLSVPEIYDDVERPAKIRVRYLDYDGSQKEVEADGLLATCLQHEMDHLKGVLFIDHLSMLKRGMIVRKLTKAKKRAVAG